MSRPSTGSHKANMNSSKQSSSLKAKGLKDIRIDEEVKIAVNVALQRFQYSEQKEMEFPSSLTSTERAFIHRLAQSLGYISKSRGKGSNRFLTIRKKDGSEAAQSIMTFNFAANSKHVVRSLLQRFPVTNKERTELLPRTERGLSVSLEAGDSMRDKNRTSGRLNNGIPQVPQKRGPSELECFRRALPVFERQEEIVATIKENQVVLVVGETGSGKTTQIPQFLLDDCSRKGTPCRIFCTQPRRLAAIAVAERVAAERGESVGQTIGYQIRLESRVSPKTLLTFCTSGVLLRTLMAGDATLSTVTHVIVDEVHERDGLTDFLLTKMRDMLQKMPSLKLILSSAALDVDLFIRYFGKCPIIYIKGRPFEVKQLFLEDILRTTGYMSKDMMKYKKEMQKEEKRQTSLTEWCEVKEGVSRPEPQRDKPPACILQENDLLDDGGESVFSQLNEKDVASLEPWLLKEMDTCISDIFLEQDADAFIQLFNLILNENISVDYRHSETSATPLMVAAGRGFISQMEQLLSMGASVHIKASNSWTALDWARHFNQTEAVDLLESHISSLEAGQLDESSLVQSSSGELSAEDQELLKAYHHSFDDEKVDLDLIMHLLYNICQSSDEGAVLIFLPGYDEIVGLRDRLLFDDKRFAEHQQRYQVFTLHSNMQTSDQRKVLKPSPNGVRKIILSTNIAETSITVNDVVFVIDSGKVKEKAFDALNHVTMLKMVWISKASALQRKGRAGRCRPGICFHLFSRLRFNNMLEHQVPQLLRMPLQELCLHTKLLAPINCPIAEFLAKAPEPPHLMTVKNAVQMLKTIDAMDPWEDLTELGYHLADLPVEPHLGKMVLCAVVLKCLDPILTIACTLAYRDPFVLPAQASQKRAAMLCRKRFAANAFSDHMALLRAFQAWQKARGDGWERSFCEKNFLSQATMEIIIGMRTQLLGQLRAIGFVRARGGGDIRDVNLNSENWAVVKAALVAGMYPNLTHVDRESLTLMGAKEKKVRFHPTSVLSQPQYKKIPPANAQAAAVQSLPTDWLIYDEMTRAHRIASVRCCTVVTPLTVAVFGGCAKLPSTAFQEPAMPRAVDEAVNESSDSEMEDRSTAHLAQIKIDEWLNFKLDREMADLVFQLRQRWQGLFLRRIRSPSKPWSQLDEATIRALVSVLSTEEQASGLQQPTGVGQRPKPMSSDEPPQPSSWKSTNSRRSLLDTERGEEAASADRPPRLSPALPQSKSHREKGAAHSKRSTDDHLSVKADSPSFNSPSTSPSSTSSGKCSKSPSPRCPAPVRYFIMKSSNLRNIELSQQRGIWSTTPSNEHKLNRAFQENSVVFLIFSVQGSGHFQGYARMSSEIGSERCQDWGSSGLGGVFRVEWIRKESLPFQFTHQLLNPWNDNKKVQISRDGQELEPQAGAQLLQLWDRISTKQQHEL
ncbi:3'-5' RNA helicase YTHDC2 [Colossoma macropomum]|uniref:3'-5' RNA helicase YTHDC2 n=1 Tax=Colossoma macropomum TaxID=42526 RepID=UPI001864DAC4|nr:3'-5' RNA helicase YTHDC2 [Colossoma macropomum]XP_036436606.1 3'-5' RNA helicase YTHDC2 [Colossoma macropomum]XP_036436607.1 3'-5' RNA helicase YTHDC2 [Colossoma macropomum]